MAKEFVGYVACFKPQPGLLGVPLYNLGLFSFKTTALLKEASRTQILELVEKYLEAVPVPEGYLPGKILKVYREEIFTAEE